MHLICSCQHFLKEENVQLIQNVARLIHKAKLAPVYIIEADSPKQIRQLNLFDEVREASTFFVADDARLYPPVSNDALFRKLNAVGWGGMKVAVLDTGVRPEQVSVSFSKDFTGYGNIIVHNHGTRVAKIINHFSPRAFIESYKIGHHGNDIKEGFIFMALDEVMEHEVDLVNLSISFQRHCKGSCELCNYINAFVDATGSTVVVAAGNDGQYSFSTIGCPGAAEKVITVGAVDPSKMLADFSSIGEPGFDKPNILAPGYVDITMRFTSGFAIESDTGTSYAAPVITGILSSLFSIYPDRAQIITKMYETCESIGMPRHEQGFGLLDLDRLVEVCLNDDAISRASSRQKST
ncbi:S8 family peptidase [Brevibacillus panacihumi]|uniref:Peptidase S8/S53 domain-containing protein n=1 Tax=Brevibacillus panacihumi TaxID=497735 RepID=A0A3M8CUU8_9BACL|nr:S8 family serine peptidase [Brevibacillus panacihumi]RNB79037.1 hypothetical protein EDM58_10165 [Brevibacillus panacihumi]